MIWQALHKAMEYIPPCNRQEIRNIICSGCYYEHEDPEVGCTCCLSGSMFLDKDPEKYERNFRRGLSLIEDGIEMVRLEM